MKKTVDSFKVELRFARRIWSCVKGSRLAQLRQLLQTYKLSVTLGDLIEIDNRWYVTHAGLLRLASRRRCDGIQTALQRRLSDPAANRWVFRATVFKSASSKGFVGYGDADPSNVSTLMQGAEMRIAETRAVNRALRKAYGIGLCSVEELGMRSASSNPPETDQGSSNVHSQKGSNNGQPRLRDQLCLLIRQYDLDPTLVKSYAADFCGTESLRDAGRDLVESFVSHIATSAKENRDGLICKLNSYARPQEARP